jgi:hypothetical protein
MSLYAKCCKKNSGEIRRKQQKNHTCTTRSSFPVRIASIIVR